MKREVQIQLTLIIHSIHIWKYWWSVYARLATVLEGAGLAFDIRKCSKFKKENPTICSTSLETVCKPVLFNLILEQLKKPFSAVFSCFVLKNHLKTFKLKKCWKRPQTSKSWIKYTTDMVRNLVGSKCSWLFNEVLCLM